MFKQNWCWLIEPNVSAKCVNWMRDLLKGKKEESQNEKKMWQILLNNIKSVKNVVFSKDK